MDKSKIYDILKIICTAVLSVAATLLAHSCAVSTQVQKNTQNSSINGEQNQQTKIDSTTLKLY